MPLLINLFSGMGLSSMGFRQAGWEVMDFELNPATHHLACKYHELYPDLPSVTCVQKDVLDLSLSAEYFQKCDAIWASPPCQTRSQANHTGVAERPEYGQDLLQWSLNLQNLFPNKIVWVENVLGRSNKDNAWGKVYNAHQFGTDQNRNRVIGGNYPSPEILKPYQRKFEGICTTVLATEYKGSAGDRSRASRWYGRRLTLEEVAYHMDVDPTVISRLEEARLPGFTPAKWRYEIYRGLGNGVPVKMAKAFAEAVKQ